MNWSSFITRAGPPVLIGVVGATWWLRPLAPPRPLPEDKCPVCGMLVAKYPAWKVQLRFSDGAGVSFDGAKDFFRFYFAQARFDPHHDRHSVVAVTVTDYYSQESTDAYTAHYVLGSDVRGPMGHELVPFRTAAAAREFAQDHHGRQVLRFEDVEAGILESLDAPAAASETTREKGRP